jgi:hypothetical protein
VLGLARGGSWSRLISHYNSVCKAFLSKQILALSKRIAAPPDSLVTASNLSTHESVNFIMFTAFRANKRMTITSGKTAAR